MEFVAIRLLAELLLPPFSTFLLLLLAFVLRGRWRRTSLGLAVLATLLHFGLALTGVGNALRAPWPVLPERIEPPYAQAEAIVVLGGGRVLAAPEWGGDTASGNTLRRVRYAAKLHRQTGLPILVSGGRPGGEGSLTEAAIMRDILQDEFQVPVRWVEDRAEDTRDNARFSAELLRADGVARIHLVTTESHMPRALQDFRAAGLQPNPMPIEFAREPPPTAMDWLPTAQGLFWVRIWLFERLAELQPG